MNGNYPDGLNQTEFWKEKLDDSDQHEVESEHETSFGELYESGFFFDFEEEDAEFQEVDVEIPF